MALKRKALERSLKLTKPISPETAELLHRAVQPAVAETLSEWTGGASPPPKIMPI